MARRRTNKHHTVVAFTSISGEASVLTRYGDQGYMCTYQGADAKTVAASVARSLGCEWCTVREKVGDVLKPWDVRGAH